MTKKLTKHGNSFALIIDKPILELLGINEKTNLTISIQKGALIVKPASKKTGAVKKREADIDEIADRIMDKYEAVFKKLSKT